MPGLALTEDDVDGPRRKSNSAAQIVDAFFKLAFLKILIVDIGISLGDTVTDGLQSANLMLDLSTGGVRWNSAGYGLGLLLAAWLPLPVAALHLATAPDLPLASRCFSLSGLLWAVPGVLLFPLLPTACYTALLISPRRTPRHRARYKLLERQAHELKSICGAVEAPVQLALLLHLMLRGILTLPWSESPSARCVTDSLGRVACLPSIPMASVIFSVLSIAKAFFDLNLYPLVRELHTCSATLRLTASLLLRFFPFFLANTLFRVSAFSLMFVYLDYWSIIPCSLLFLINLMVFGISFKRFSGSVVESECEDQAEFSSVQLNRLSTADMALKPLQFGSSSDRLPVTPTDEEKLRAVVGWVPPGDTPVDTLDPAHHLRPQFGQYERVGWNPHLAILSATGPDPGPQPPPQPDTAPWSLQPGLVERMQSLISSSEETETPSYINEENTSIFLNAVTGMFLPSCHTHLQTIGTDLADSDPETFFARNRERQEGLVGWQSRIYQRQVYIFNTALLLILATIFILVSSVSSFNYSTNVLSWFWFCVCLALMLLSGLLSLVLTWALSRPALLPAAPPTARPAQLVCSALQCAAWCCLVLGPVLLGLAIYTVAPRADPYLFLVQPGTGPSNNIALSIITAFPVVAPAGLGLVRGPAQLDCYTGPGADLAGRLLIVNTTRPQCRALLAEDGAQLLQQAGAAGAAGVILLDNTVTARWRVSSPASLGGLLPAPGPAPGLPVLLVREADWRRFDTALLAMDRAGADLFIVWNDPTELRLQEIFTCSSRPTVQVGGGAVGGPASCREGKHLYSNGTVAERICVTGECSVFGEILQHQVITELYRSGQRCPHSVFDSLSQFSVELECGRMAGLDLEFESSAGRPLGRAQLWSEAQRAQSDYCCHNNTFLEVTVFTLQYLMYAQSCNAHFQIVLSFLNSMHSEYFVCVS